HIRRQPVAFVALFFALSGAAVAGAGYLKASDKITKGDLAGSTYGDPVIAAHKVTNKKLQHASLTVATDGSTLTGGGPINLGGSNSTPLGVADGGITNTKPANPSLTITAGTGLTGGGSIALGSSGGLSVDPTVVRNRVSNTCSSGSAISSINQDGTVGCQSDAFASFSAG